MDERAKFVVQWFARAQESMDDFEKFIFLWLAMIVSVKAWAANNGYRPTRNEEANDGWYVSKYFSSRHSADNLIRIFESTGRHLQLATRKSVAGDYIVSSTERDQELLKQLYWDYKGVQRMVTEQKAKAIGLTLKAIRNNLFHGEKCYDSTDDSELLSLATPILQAYVIDCARRDLDVILRPHESDEQ